MPVLSSTLYPLEQPSLYTTIGMVSTHDVIIEELEKENAILEGATMPDGSKHA